jgi:methyl-accepting chemotaxis protein
MQPSVVRHTAHTLLCIAAALLLAITGGAAVWQSQPWLLLPLALAAVVLSILGARLRRGARKVQRELRRAEADARARADVHAAAAAGHAENAQIRQALDVSRTAMMIADNDHVIRYVNQSVVTLLRNQQVSLREAFPDFDAERLVGSSIHRGRRAPGLRGGMA